MTKPEIIIHKMMRYGSPEWKAREKKALEDIEKYHKIYRGEKDDR